MNAVMDALAEYVEAGDVVYTVWRHQRIGVVKRLLDILITNDLFNDARSIVRNASSQTVLVAGDRRAVLLVLQDHEVVQQIEVPDWDPRLKNDFRRLVIDGVEYRKVSRESR